MKPAQKIHVSIVESNPLYLQAYLHLLTTDNRFNVITYGSSAKEIFQRINDTPPDIILCNLDSEDWDATKLLLEIKNKCLSTKIVVNDKVSPGSLIKLLLKSGVATYFLKDQVRKEELSEIIIHTYNHGYSFTSIVTEDMIKEIRGGLNTGLFHNLSEREFDILKLTCEGWNRKQISNKLFIAEATVKFHLDKLRERYNCKTVVQLAVSVVRSGVLADQPVLSLRPLANKIKRPTVSSKF